MIDAIAPVALAGLAGWRAALFLVREGGPWNLASRLRHLMGVRFSVNTGLHSGGGPFSCVWCCSVYTTVLMYAAYEWLEWERAVAVIAAMAIPVALQQAFIDRSK